MVSGEHGHVPLQRSVLGTLCLYCHKENLTEKVRHMGMVFPQLVEGVIHLTGRFDGLTHCGMKV